MGTLTTGPNGGFLGSRERSRRVGLRVARRQGTRRRGRLGCRSAQGASWGGRPPVGFGLTARSARWGCGKLRGIRRPDGERPNGRSSGWGRQRFPHGGLPRQNVGQDAHRVWGISRRRSDRRCVLAPQEPHGMAHGFLRNGSFGTLGTRFRSRDKGRARRPCVGCFGGWWLGRPCDPS